MCLFYFPYQANLVPTTHIPSHETCHPIVGRVLILCPTNATYRKVYERLEPLLHPDSPCKHELSYRCYDLCRLRTPRAFTRPTFPGRHELPRQYYSLCSLRTSGAFTRPGVSGRHDLANTAACAVMTPPTM